MAVSVPSDDEAYAVKVTIGGVAVPVWDKYGNPITASVLKKCRLYKGYYGATTSHVILNTTPITCGSCGNVL